MGSSWDATTIGDLCDRAGGDIQTGPFGSQLHAHDYVSDGPVPVVTTSAVGRRRIQPNGVPRISRAMADSLGRHYLEAGDIVFARRGAQAAGLSALVEPQHAGWLGGTGIIRLRIPSQAVDPNFLSFVLSHESTYEWIRQHAIGATMPNLNEGVIRAVPVRLPPLDEQRRIAAILGALDDKIELNRRMNKTLEEMAQAIFKSWFIDFDGHTDFVDSELGRIPKGWQWVPFADAGTWVSGGTPNKNTAAFWGGDIPWFSAKSLGPLWLHDSEDRVTEVGAQNGTRLVPRRTVLFIVRGMSLAKEWRIGLTSREATLNQDLKAIVDDGTVVPELLLLWLLEHRELIRAKADEAGHGTKRLPTEVLHSHYLAMPPRGDQERLAEPLQAMLGRVELSQTQSSTLTELRDALLPKLISGEIRVPEAEKVVEAVA